MIEAICERVANSTLYSFLLVYVVVFCSSPIVAAESAAVPQGFVSLFNGEDLSGWCGRVHTNPVEFRDLAAPEKARRQNKADASVAAHWSVKNGVIVNDGHGAYLTTVEVFEDFELLVDWKMVDPVADSGIYLRGCPQVQIWNPANESQHQHGAQLGSGGLWNNNPGSPGKDPLVKADRPVGQWNTLRIRLVGDRATIHLNDQLVVDDAVMHNYFDRKNKLYRRGPIQLQTHGGEMHFRNVYVRRLSSANQPDRDSTSASDADYSRIILKIKFR